MASLVSSIVALQRPPHESVRCEDGRLGVNARGPRQGRCSSHCRRVAPPPRPRVTSEVRVRVVVWQWGET